MAGYTSDQFFHSQEPAINGTTPTGTSTSSLIPANNAPFGYQGSVRLTKPSFDKKNQFTGLVSQEVVLDHGYIRSLMTYSNGINLPIKKCKFQFNPDVLQHSVEANSSMLNFLQQDPAQYAQPMPGNINFTFQLRFDRSHELNNPTGSAITTGNVWEVNNPSQVGVLHDLAALYNVIGQGIGSSQIDYLTKVIQNSAISENNKLVAASSGSSSSSSTATGGLSTDSLNKTLDTVPDFLKNNIGNVTFLLPVPVRVVFSSLYIVEGLIKTSDVSFTKFTTQMVPMQCVVQLTMEAKYVGFAKPDTFFSWSLKEQEKQQRADIAAANAAKADLVNAFKAEVQAVNVAIAGGTDSDSGFPYTLLGPRGTKNYSSGSLYSTITNNNVYGIRTRFYPSYSRDATNAISGDKVTASNQVTKLFKDKTSLSVDQYTTVWFCGPFTDLNYASSYDSDKLKAEIAKLNKNGSTPTLFRACLNHSCLGGHAGSDKDWHDLMGGVYGSRSVIMQDSSTNSDKVSRTDSKANSVVGIASASYDTTKYYIVAIEVGITVTDGDTSVKGTGIKYALVKPGYGTVDMTYSVPITWPNVPAGDGTGGGGGAPPPAAGDTSVYGKTKIPVAGKGKKKVLI